MLNLQFTDQTKPSAVKARQRDPVIVFKAALTKQIEACRATQSGKTYTVKRRRYTGGKETHIDVPLRPWWWQQQTDYYITLRYSSQTVNINDHPTIIAGPTLTDVEEVLTTVLTLLDDNDVNIVNAVNAAYERTRWSKRKGGS